MRTLKEIEDRILRLNIVLEENLGVFISTSKRMLIRYELNILNWFLGGEEYKQNPQTLKSIGGRLGLGKEKEVIDFFTNNPDKSFTKNEIMENVEISQFSLADILPELVNSKRIKITSGLGKRGNPYVYQFV